MKRLFGGVLIFVSLLAAGMACAATDLTDEDYKDITQLKKKLVRMKREMDSFMKDIVSTYPDQKTSFDSLDQDVKIDVAENEKDFVVKADLPGMAKDRIDVTLENDRLLRISGAREAAASQTSPGMVRQERNLGKFERTVELPSACRADGIKASYDEGVLEVVIPKKEIQPESKIKVKVQ